jgi:hypothetical protein
MPPYPLYNEPSIPGATGLDTPVAAASPATQQGLHTHSSKFPIEREVILSSTDKNSKIPILHDYKKRTKGAIAPDVPPKQMAAWTAQGQTHQILSPDQVRLIVIHLIVCGGALLKFTTAIDFNSVFVRRSRWISNTRLWQGSS